MKVNSIASMVNLKNNFLRAERKNTQNAVSVNNYSMGVQPLRMITFGGNKIKDQVALVVSESKEYGMKGGVATVVKDYPGNVFGTGMNAPLIIPYYNSITLSDDGKKIESLDVLTKNGVPIFSKINSAKTRPEDLSEADKGKNYFELGLIAKKEMEWNGKMVPIAAYQVKDPKNKGKYLPHFMIYTPTTAQMFEPYTVFNIKGKGNQVAYGSDSVAYDTDQIAYGSDSVGYDSEQVAYGTGSAAKRKKEGAEYAAFSKALVELLPDMEKAGVNPQHLLLNDAQTAYIPEFIAQKAAKGDDYYKDTKVSFVQHNLGDGYQQILDNETMFRSFADNDTINAVENDPVYKKAKQIDSTRKFGQNDNDARETEQYFKKLVAPFIRTDGIPSASMVPIRYAKENNVAHISGVSELYVQDCLDNPNVAKGLTKHLEELTRIGKLSGILNGRGEADINPANPINKFFSTYQGIITDNLGNTHKPFVTFSKDMPVEEIIKAKKQNAANLIGRLQDGVEPIYSIGTNRGKAIIGHIDKKWADKINNGEDVTLFVFWGRADDQKGADNVLEAFARFAKTPEGQNSVLVAGGELEKQSAERAIREKLAQMSEDDELVGRFAYMNGFAPNAILSSAGDAAIFPSRWAPCELTDLEAMKFGATPIVTNLQGLKQKNFDPRNPEEASRATSYKTDAHFYMKEKDVIARSDEYSQKKEEMIQETLKKYELDDTPQNRKVADKIVKQSKRYEFLWRKVTDELTTQDLVEAMKAKVTESPETRAKLIKNTMSIKSGWQNNHKLHPEGNKSSQDLYYERHINGDSTPAARSVFVDSMKDEMAKIKERAAAAGSDNITFSGWQNKALDLAKGLKNRASELLQNKVIKGYVGGGVAAAAIVGGTAAVVSALNNQKEQQKPHASARLA